LVGIVRSWTEATEFVVFLYMSYESAVLEHVTSFILYTHYKHTIYNKNNQIQYMIPHAKIKETVYPKLCRLSKHKMFIVS
jgi:hypothetical protein